MCLCHQRILLGSTDEERICPETMELLNRSEHKIAISISGELYSIPNVPREIELISELRIKLENFNEELFIGNVGFDY